MPYVEDITEPLIKTLAHAAGLPVNQLAGHASNIGFWTEEVAHALRVIDGYSERLENMRAGQRRYAEDNLVYPSHTEPIKPGIKDAERVDLRRRLVEVFSRFVARGFKEGLIVETELDHLIVRFDLDPADVKRR